MKFDPQALRSQVVSDLEDAHETFPEDYQALETYTSKRDALASWFTWNGVPVSYLDTVINAYGLARGRDL